MWLSSTRQNITPTSNRKWTVSFQEFALSRNLTDVSVIFVVILLIDGHALLDGGDCNKRFILQTTGAAKILTRHRNIAR